MAVVIVVGGAGRMGSWFGTLLKQHGYQVAIFDRNKRAAHTTARRKGFKVADSLESSFRSAQLLVLATPTRETEQILRYIAPKLHSNTLLLEISSIKEPLRETLERLSRLRIPILSIHPMFGPGTKTLRDRTVFATSIPKRNAQASEILSIFQKRGARLVRCSIREHDGLMSALLTLPHFLNIAMAKTLKAKGFDPGELREFSGTTFGLQLLIGEVIHQENPENEASILMDTEESMTILVEYLKQCRNLLSSLRRGERGRIIRDLSSSRSYLEHDRAFATAYENFNAAATTGVR